LIVLLAIMAVSQPAEIVLTHEPRWCETAVFAGKHQSCVLDLGDGRFATVGYEDEYFEDESGDELRRVSISIVDLSNGPVRAGDEPAQTIETAIGRTFVYPHAEDVTGDGVPELFFPRYTGNVNTDYDVYAEGVDRSFTLVGYVSGFGVGYDSEIGYLAVHSRSSAVSYLHEVFDIREGQLVYVYSLSSFVEQQSCGFSEGPAFAESGLDASEIRTRCQADIVGGNE
jgi:hypothetical protein